MERTDKKETQCVDRIRLYFEAGMLEYDILGKHSPAHYSNDPLYFKAEGKSVHPMTRRWSRKCR